MTIIYVHVSMFLIIFIAFLFFFLQSIVLAYSSLSYLLSIDIYSRWFFSLDLSFYIDSTSSLFISIILLISSIIIVYSYNYIMPYSIPYYFLWVTILFVLSMLLVVSISSLFYLILGWDGLGLVSFFLIIYYQNSRSVYSGLFTLLINRIGDGFFLVSIALFTLTYLDMFRFSRDLTSFFLCFVTCVAFITKTALYPFSSWLPIAIAAPTPISALVHSSTLVTAGLFLIMRFNYVLYAETYLISFLTIIGLFTSFYAGANAVFETDIKKLIALSTLSHLGFIVFSFSLGLLALAFFHLLVHALFKSLLFMSIGDIIVSINHRQDIRYLSSGGSYTPFSFFIIAVSLINLLGIPNLSGFYSKDLVLESFSYSRSSYFLCIILYFNVVFTYFYTFTLFYFSYSSCKLVSFQLFHSPVLIHSVLLFVLGCISILFGKFFLTVFESSILFVAIPLTIKILPVTIDLLIFLYLVLFLSFPTVKRKSISYYFSNIIYLTPLLSSCSSFLYYKWVFTAVKSLELGIINNLLQTKLSSSFFLFGFQLYKFHGFNFLTTALTISLLFFILI